MNDEKKPSERQQIAHRIAQFLLDHNLCEVFGGDVVHHGRYYSVTFSIRRTLDGEVRVYSPNFIQILLRGPAAWVIGGGSGVYESEKAAIDFLRLGYVEHKHAEAQAIPTKPRKST